MINYCFIRGLRPELEIRVVEKDTFKEVINDTIDTERRLAANSALQRNRNTDYLKTEELTNNKNNKTTRLNVALEDKIICLIFQNPCHTTEKCFHSNLYVKKSISGKTFQRRSWYINRIIIYKLILFQIVEPYRGQR